MAKKFHIKNGANTFRINNLTINYEYPWTSPTKMLLGTLEQVNNQQITK
jgi:hypothetical protein